MHAGAGGRLSRRRDVACGGSFWTGRSTQLSWLGNLFKIRPCVYFRHMRRSGPLSEGHGRPSDSPRPWRITPTIVNGGFILLPPAMASVGPGRLGPLAARLAPARQELVDPSALLLGPKGRVVEVPLEEIVAAEAVSCNHGLALALPSAVRADGRGLGKRDVRCDEPAASATHLCRWLLWRTAPPPGRARRGRRRRQRPAAACRRRRPGRTADPMPVPPRS